MRCAVLDNSQRAREPVNVQTKVVSLHIALHARARASPSEREERRCSVVDSFFFYKHGDSRAYPFGSTGFFSFFFSFEKLSYGWEG